MAKSKEKFRVLVADDHAIFREGLCKLLEAEENMQVVGEACEAEACLRLVKTLQPDVVLLDLRMPGRSGLEVLTELGGTDAVTRSIILTASEDEKDFVEAVRRGARGVVLKQAASDVLLDGIRKVGKGEMWIDQRVVAGLVEAISRPVSSAVSFRRSLLTTRELEVVTLVTQGLRNKEIAKSLSIHEQTVKNHLHNIYDKLGVSDRLELALYAMHHRLVERS